MALGGVALVLFSAAKVLSVGFTTLGQLADLDTLEARRQDHVRHIKSEVDASLKQIKGIARQLMKWWGTVRVNRAKHRLPPRQPQDISMPDLADIEIADLVQYLERDTRLFSSGLGETIPELYGAIEEANTDLVRVRTPEQHTQGATSKQSVNEVEWRARRLELAAGTLVAFANQFLLERHFAILKSRIRGGGLLVAIGVGLFAIAPKLGLMTLTVDEPTPVTVVVSTPDQFGRNCRSQELPGVAVGGTWDRPIVATRPVNGCIGRRLELRPDVGFVVPLLPLRG